MTPVHFWLWASHVASLGLSLCICEMCSLKGMESRICLSWVGGLWWAWPGVLWKPENSSIGPLGCGEGATKWGRLGWEKAGAGVRDIPLESGSCSPTTSCAPEPALDTESLPSFTQVWGFLGTLPALKSPSIWYCYHPSGWGRLVGLAQGGLVTGQSKTRTQVCTIGLCLSPYPDSPESCCVTPGKTSPSLGFSFPHVHLEV